MLMCGMSLLRCSGGDCHHQVPPKRVEGRLDLVETRRMTAVEQARHFRGLPIGHSDRYYGFSKGSKKEIASASLYLGFQGLGDLRNLGGTERV
jgi:hypothetical protein